MFFSKINFSQILIAKAIALVIFLLILFHSPASANSSINSGDKGFTENKGQVADVDGNLRPDILYTASSAGMSVFIRETGVSYVLQKSDDIPEKAWRDPESLKKYNYYTHRVDADFVACNSNTIWQQSDEEKGYKNFYFPHCKDGITQVKSYRSIIQKNLYDNIDIVYKGDETQGLKYDIVVRPGGNPDNIRIQYNGANELQITEEGALRINTSLGELKEWMPRVYQNINGKIVDVDCKYILNGNMVNLKLSPYNLQHTLIIDPWIRYIGGGYIDRGRSINKDASGNIVFTGNTQSNNLPVLGAIYVSISGSQDLFIGKVDASGNLQWLTYYGGTGFDESFGICTDKGTEDIYTTGYTQSLNFPVVSGLGHMFNYPGMQSAFIVKLNSSGTLIWTTFYGDKTNITEGTDVTTDQNNDVILYGKTQVSVNIATAGVFQTAIASSGMQNGDLFVAKFTPSGNRIWGSYCGGQKNEQAGSVSCDASNNIYISGSTLSSDFPVSGGAHQGTYGGGVSDAFLFKFSPTGQRVWGTYYGGAGIENPNQGAVEIDLNGNVYIGGRTESTTGMATAGAYQPAKNPGAADAFLAKFNSSGVVLWATYLGGSTAAPLATGANDYIMGIAIDDNNNVVVAGDTYSTDFPVTNCTYQNVFQGTEDQFISTFDTNGNLLCSGFLGQGNLASENNETDESRGGCIITSGVYAYLIATSECEYNYPVTINTCAGNVDAVIAKFCITTCGLSKITANFTADKTIICTVGDSINFTLKDTSCEQGNTTYLWAFEGAIPSTSTEENPSNIVYTTEGSFDVKVVIESPCAKDSVIKNDYINIGSPIASFTATPQPTSLVNPTINFINQSTGEVQWMWSFGDVIGSSSDKENPIFTYQDSGTYIVQLVVFNQYGCSDTIENIIMIDDAQFAFYAPNTFTPNNDGINDFFIPKNIGVDNTEYLLIIYDRWGELIFSTTDPAKGWNGRANNGKHPAQIDTYVWKVTLKDIFGERHEYLGHVNLVR